MFDIKVPLWTSDKKENLNFWKNDYKTISSKLKLIKFDRVGKTFELNSFVRYFNVIQTL